MVGSRRKFIWSAGLLAGSAVMGGSSLSAREITTAMAERDVAKVISGYGTSVQVTRSGDRTSEYRVKVGDIGKFAETFTSQDKLPFDRIYVSSGNTLKFTHGGIDFTLVNIA